MGAHLHLNGLFFPEKSLQIRSKSAYKSRRYLLLNNATASLVTVKHLSVIYEKRSEKHHTLSFRADVRCSISTKLCMMTEDVHAVIASRNYFVSDQ